MNSRNFEIKLKKLNVKHYNCFRPGLPAARRLGRGLVRVRGAGAGVHRRHQLQHQVLWRRKAHNQNFEGLTPILLSSIRHKGTCVMKIRHSDSQFIFRSQEEGGWQPFASPSVEKLKGEKNEISRTILSLWRVLQLHKKSAKSCSKLLDQVPGHNIYNVPSFSSCKTF